MVGLVIETPLADDQVGTRVLELLNHLRELALLIILKLLKLLHRGNVQLVLGLGLRGFEGASQDSQLGVLDFVRHLRVGEVLVDDNTVDKQRVFEGTSDLAIHLDQFEVDILALQIRNGQHRIHGNLGELVMRLGDTAKTLDRAKVKQI